MFRSRATAKQAEHLGYSPESWLWCLHCNRCYQVKDATYRQGIVMCAYYDCDGDALFDGWEWSQVQEANGYPAQPEKGKPYPQYGEKV